METTTIENFAYIKPVPHSVFYCFFSQAEAATLLWFFFQETSCMRFPMQCNFVVSKLAGYPCPQSCNICVGETFFFRVLTLTLSFHNYLLTIVIPIRFPSLDLTGRIFMMQFSMFPWLPFDFLPATGQRRLGLCLWVSVRGCFTNKPKMATSQVHA